MALLEPCIDPSLPVESPNFSLNASFSNTPSESNEFSPYYTHRNYENDDNEKSLRSSYTKYACWNSGRFILIGFLIVIIAMMRQLRLLQHYNIPACCFCYYIAAQNNGVNNIRYEWQTCEVQTWDVHAPSYNHRMTDPNKDCGYNVLLPDPQDLGNLSYNLIKIPWFYGITAGIVLFICLLYAFLICYLSTPPAGIAELLRRLSLERLILFNVLISTLCFFQIIIDYQFHKKEYKDFNVDMIKQPNPTREHKYCYINSLNDIEKLIMQIVSITAFAFITVPCFKALIIHCCCKDNTDCVARTATFFDKIVCGLCGIVTVIFLVIVVLYSGMVIFYKEWKFKWFNYPAVILVDILLLMSLFDVYCMATKVVKYNGNPYMTICGYLMCCNWSGDYDDDEIGRGTYHKDIAGQSPSDEKYDEESDDESE